MLPLGSMVAASIIAVGAWFAVGALRTDTPEVGDIELIRDTTEVEDIALITDTPEVEDIALITDTPDVYDIKVVSFSMDVYSSLEGLTGAADVVVLGTVMSVAGSGLSRGKEGDGSPIPYTLYELEVHETFKGDASGTIYVPRTDPSYLEDSVSFHDAPLTKLVPGETVILYLDSMSADIEPTITIADTIYVPLGFDNGVFDITASGPSGPVGTVDDDTKVHPRGVSPSMFAKGTVFTAADIRQAIEPDSGEEGPVGSTN